MPRQTNIAKRQKAAVSKPKPLSLLILECDAQKLEKQGLTFAGDLYKIVSALPAKITVEVGMITSQANLLEVLVNCKEKYSSIQNIVVIAHSNRNVISVARDLVPTWKAFAQWIKPFKPKQIVFIACEAGQFWATRTLFDEIPQLTKIYASPMKTTKPQFKIIHALVSYLLLTKKQDKDLIWADQVVNFVNTGGVILQCTRRNPEWNQIWQFLGGLAQ
jgi:hypothetical protein